jgi:sensor domain CHASE-containing protein
MQRNAALSTIARGNLTMDGPTRVLQGYDGLFFRVPIFVPTNNPRETWG